MGDVLCRVREPLVVSISLSHQCRRGACGVSVGMGPSSLTTQPPPWAVSVNDFFSFSQFPTWSLKRDMTFFALMNKPVWWGGGLF